MRKPKFLGVYSLARTPAKKTLRKGKQFYFVWELDKTTYAIQLLNEAMVPQSRPELISKPRLQTGFRLEPAILANPITTPDFRQIPSQSGSQKSGEATPLTDAALHKLEQARKTKQIETDMRGNFDKAIRALSRPRDRKGALAALEKLSETKDGIVPDHKHMFRDFGVSLRKQSLPELALRYAQRVLELAPNDDHAHFNIARILAILGYYDQAQAHITKAISLDSKENIYLRMRKYLEGLQSRSSSPSYFER